MLEQWSAEVVDHTWHVGFLATEHLLEGTLNEFLWWDSHGQVDRQTA